MRPHVVVAPIPVQGHLRPFLRLAEYLADEGVEVTFVHTQSTISRLAKTSTDHHISGKGNAVRGDNWQSSSSPYGTAAPDYGGDRMRIEVVPDLLSDGAPFAEALWASMPLMKKGLEEVVDRISRTAHASVGGDGAADSRLVCLILDNAFIGAHDVAYKRGIPVIEVITVSAAAYAIGIFAPQLAERGYVLPVEPGSAEGHKLVDFIPGLPPFLRMIDMPLIIIENEFNSAAFQWFCTACANYSKADRVLVNTFYELEKDVISALHKHKIDIRIDAIGPLLPLPNSNGPQSQLLLEDNSCIRWLETQPKASVVYVSFGSMVTLDAHAIHELALGLEASQQRFLWVIRSDARKTDIDTLLPLGMKESLRTGHGLIISWAPQLAILAHPSTGAFVTHCGWNSTLEAVSFGVPMIGIPQAAEQNTNLKFIADIWKVGVGLSNSYSYNGATTFDHESINASVTAIMCGEKGKEVRAKALEFKLKAKECMLFPYGTSKNALQKLVRDLKNGNLRKPPLSYE